MLTTESASVIKKTRRFSDERSVTGGKKRFVGDNTNKG
jgi:hypothetical protein